jgi:putative ABC transport system substrate-binding protein
VEAPRRGSRDVSVAGTGTAIRAVMAASPSVPVVSIGTPDPVRAGFVKSLARPGGQVTGISNLSDVLVPKQIELLKAAVPGAKRIAFSKCSLCQLRSGLTAEHVKEIERERAEAARSVGAQLLPLNVSSVDDFAAAVAQLQRERPDGLVIGTNEISFPLRARWVAYSFDERLPMMSFNRGYGSTFSYGVDAIALYRLAAEYVGKLLNGAEPRTARASNGTAHEA